MSSPMDTAHKDSPGMPQLKHLMMSDEEPTPTTSGADDGPKTDDPETFFNEDVPLVASALGDSVDTLLLAWTQLLTNTGTKHPSLPPTLDHVKEVAAVGVQYFRDACADLNAQFAKVALEWELENGEKAEDERVAALKASISRQVTLLNRSQAALDLRTEEYFITTIDGSQSSE